jgi:hypothetical protein
MATAVDVPTWKVNNILVKSPTGSMGSSNGGAVTQATNKSTTVVLSTITGAITMNGAALAADVIVSFTLTNTLIGADDLVIVNHKSGGTVGKYIISSQPAAGSAVITVTNISTGSLSEAIVIQFFVLKAAVA